ncbi:dcb9189a-2edd-438e-8c66-fb44a23e9934-CDS [Sclerotinia trifoliorum]|uniref:Dcb9189a-2edd-438e-8c66-fb44a23e9934-CDS n=1 Tax=Sclerotinia trifoliorum TaxID=28548 RepID=A0A8H2VWD9_9HELO|nr:dcb9189a-2edd-438e-8c66-fb44a23e9934-CDS [Sclerotinia trifoliorum]
MPNFHTISQCRQSEFFSTLIIALSVAAASAAAVEERATARCTIKTFKAACTGSSSCLEESHLISPHDPSISPLIEIPSYSFGAFIGTDTTGSGSSCSITVPTSNGKLPDVAKYTGTYCGTKFWFTHTSTDLEF